MVHELEEGNQSRDFIIEFKKSSYENKIFLLEETSWRDSNVNINFIKKEIYEFEPTTNEWFNILIIELLVEFKMVNDKIIYKLNKILKERNHYLLKLSVLDAIVELNLTTVNKLKDSTIKLIRSKKDRMIVRTQAILNSKYLKWIEDEFDKLLITYLSKSNDYRLYIRVYEFLILYRETIFTNNQILEIIDIAANKDLGKAAQKSRLELKNIIDNDLPSHLS